VDTADSAIPATADKGQARPLLIVAGMPRAGTTFVYHVLARHPGIFVPFRKELRYFSQNYRNGRSWYWQFFAAARRDQVCADVSPDYFLYPEAAERLQAFAAPVKIVMIVRAAAEWAVSLHRQVGTIEPRVPSFPDFLHAGFYPHFRFGRGPDHPDGAARFSLATGFIQAQLESYRERFQRRLLLCDFNLISRDPMPLLKAIESHSGLPPHFSAADLPGAPINAANRRQVTLLNYFLSRDAVVNLAGKLIPHALLRSVRLKMDRASSTRSPAPPDPQYASDLALARDRLAGDQAYIDRLFARSPLVLGDASLFQPAPGAPAALSATRGMPARNPARP